METDGVDESAGAWVPIKTESAFLVIVSMFTGGSDTEGVCVVTETDGRAGVDVATETDDVVAAGLPVTGRVLDVGLAVRPVNF